MDAKNGLRSQCPFEVLLAASGTLETEEYSRFSGKGSLKANFEIAPPRAEASSAGRSELESEDNTAIRGAHAEGVGTSGGGESGDTGFESGDSEASQASESLLGGTCESKSRSGGSESSKGRGAAAAKKQRMIWTLELHKRFLNAVNHLGMENAVPKVILKMMNVDGITRENVASHLQKYRLHLRHQAGSRASRVDSGLGATACAAHLPPGTAQGVPIPLAAPLPMQPSSSAAGGTALGLPLTSPMAPYQMAGSLIVGNACEHIPPQAWAAGVPGYEAVQRLARIPEKHKASLLKDLTAPRPLPEDFASYRRSRKQAFKSPTLDITPLTTGRPPPANPD